MAATASAAPAESELDRSGAEEEPRGTEPEEDAGSGQTGPTAGAQQHRLARLPLSRIKTLMKADPDVTLASQESVFIIAKATELFVEMIAKDALVYAQQGKRKTLQRKDLDNAIEAIDEFAFLEGKRFNVISCWQSSKGAGESFMVHSDFLYFVTPFKASFSRNVELKNKRNSATVSGYV
ncbi:DNA polymerase epsilon subunit 4 isoform X1 [Danio rerio]|uniref:DNA polymerase epsilon subunit 4 n=1 Tax=Danio rerio TaxID=7955 RepID=F1RCI6_DANRE|nr:DNA polymerase epsilon subunit 4 isoform X1 [Danio rerio]|eukprot:XP_017213760.1 DNA polymerase epsilon subunit 4 isoform X1 [Danio rerio]